MDGVINGGNPNSIICLPMKDAHGEEIKATLWSVECIQPFLELMKWCKSEDIGIVISSTWRIGMTTELFNEYFEKYFGRNDITEVIGLTKVCIEPYMHRGREIKDYLETHQEIEKYMCIDDSVEDILEDIPQENVYKTNLYTGLTMKDIDKIREQWSRG